MTFNIGLKPIHCSDLSTFSLVHKESGNKANVVCLSKVTNNANDEVLLSIIPLDFERDNPLLQADREERKNAILNRGLIASIQFSKSNSGSLLTLLVTEGFSEKLLNKKVVIVKND